MADRISGHATRVMQRLKACEAEAMNSGRYNPTMMALERRGLAEAVPDPQYKGLWIWQLTAAGRKMLNNEQQ